RVGTVEGDGLARIDESGTVVDEHAQGIGCVIKAVSPGIVRVESQTIPEATNGFELQSVVTGSADTLHLRYVVESRVDQIVRWPERSANLLAENCNKLSLPRLLIRQTRSGSNAVRRRNQIDRHAHLKTIAVSPDVRRFQHEIAHG